MESIDSYNMTDYTFLSKPRMEKRGGGVGMYIANRLKFKERNYINTNSDNCLYESLFVEIETEKNKIVKKSTIDHNILINKLQCYGLRGNAQGWVQLHKSKSITITFNCSVQLHFSNQLQLHHFNYNYICIMESHLLINLCSVCCDCVYR